jgi:hypothetical protein
MPDDPDDPIPTPERTIPPERSIHPEIAPAKLRLDGVKRRELSAKY